MQLSADVGAVIVNHNGADVVGACIDALRAAGVRDIVVVDNGSSDGSPEVIARHDDQVRVERLNNVGFGRGVNHGVAMLDSTYLLSINPDARVRPGALDRMVARLATDDRIGVVGPTIVTPEGTRYPSTRRFPNLVDAIGHGVVGMFFPNNQWSRRYKRVDESLEAEEDIDWVSGSAMLIRRRAFDDIAGFCPDYFMYFEDVDFCWRIHEAGWRIAFVPDAEVLHIGGTSTAKKPYRMIIAHHRSAVRYVWRTTKGISRGWLPIITVGLIVRGLVAIARQALAK